MGFVSSEYLFEYIIKNVYTFQVETNFSLTSIFASSIVPPSKSVMKKKKLAIANGPYENCSTTACKIKNNN